MELCKLKFMRFIILNGTMTEHYVFFSFFFSTGISTTTNTHIVIDFIIQIITVFYVYTRARPLFVY